MKRKSTPKIGDKILVDDQVYLVAGRATVVRKMDGRRVPVWELETRCPVCGDAFRLVEGRHSLAKREFTRRCPKHRKPGVRVPRGKGS